MNKRNAVRVLRNLQEYLVDPEEKEAVQMAIWNMSCKRARSYSKEEMRVLEENPGYMLTREFAGYTGYSKDAIITMIQKGDLTTKKVAAKTAAKVIVLIPEEAAEEWKRKR